MNPTVLPAPCRTDPYSASLRVTGGTAPYTWEISPAVEGWEAKVDPDRSDTSFGLLIGAHAGATEITVVVRDAEAREGTATYDLTPRSSCWFAYTASAPVDGATLKLVDPSLGTTPPVTFAHNQDVYDFAFSPDGKYLSYRFGADLGHEKGRYLAVVNLTTWGEQQLSFSDAQDNAGDVVTAYAWSEDSSTLAASFTSGGAQYLGGVRFGSDGQLTKLAPEQAPVSVDSDLRWVGTSGVGYYADGFIDASSGLPQLIPYVGIATGYYSPLGSLGFSQAELTADTPYQLPAFMQATNDGFFINSPSWPVLQFNWIQAGGPYPVDHTTRLVSPSGKVTADLSSRLLKLYRAEHFPEIATNAPDRDCPKLLTWAKNKERFACVRDVPADEQHAAYGELRIFDLAADDTLTVAPVQGGFCQGTSSQAATRACASPTYDYSIADSQGLPRLLSASGNWLAISADSAGANDLYLADLRTSPFELEWARKLTPSDGNAVPTLKLAFSPDEKVLLQLLGGNVVANSVLDGAFISLPGLDFHAPGSTPICSDDFQTDPDRWCGSADRAPPFQWDPRSRSVAYRSRNSANDESIVIVDFLPSSEFASHYFFAPSCGKKCGGQFAFQP